MTHRSFAEAVLSGEPLSHESFAFTVTTLEYIRNVFLKPYGRGYPGQWWLGMRPSTLRRAWRLHRMVEDDGNHFFTSDDVEYHEPTRTDYKYPDDVDLADIIVDDMLGRRPPIAVTVRLGWRRLTPKPEHPGRDRRAQLRAERVSP